MMRFVLALVVFVFTSLGTLSASQAARIEVIVNKVGQKLTVKVDGRTEYVWPISSGARGYTTPSGKFKPFRLEEEHYSKEWDDAPMPHAIFFTDRGHAIHGTLYEKSLGRPVSHGCVRLSQENARTLFELVEANGLGSTTVVVRGGFFDFGYAPKRSFADVGSDIDKTITKKRKTGGFFLFGNPKTKKVAKKPVKKPAKVADKKPDDKTKKPAAVAKKADPKAKKVDVATTKAEEKAKKPAVKATDAKCTTKDGKKVCPKAPAAKAAATASAG
jgi:hypothetical protein